MSEEVTILKSDYERLLRDSLFLQYLQIEGVDNWQGYDDACMEYHIAAKEQGLESDDV